MKLTIQVHCATYAEAAIAIARLASGAEVLAEVEAAAKPYNSAALQIAAIRAHLARAAAALARFEAAPTADEVVP
jgi:hypothetical protein